MPRPRTPRTCHVCGNRCRKSSGKCTKCGTWPKRDRTAPTRVTARKARKLAKKSPRITRPQFAKTVATLRDLAVALAVIATVVEESDL